MIDKINMHYSMTNPASVYDEEALTALELAGRTAEKVNKCVDEVNKIPENISAETQKHIDNGTFDAQIEKQTVDIRNEIKSSYDGVRAEVATASAAMNEQYDELDGRVNNLVKAPAGSTALDVEIIDARIGQSGVTHETLGEAFRNEIGYISSKVCLETENVKLDINFNNKTISFGLKDTTKRGMIWSENRVEVFAIGTADKTLSFSGIESATYCVVYNTMSNELRFVNQSEYTELYKPFDIILCVAYMTPNAVNTWVYCGVETYTNGVRATHTHSFKDMFNCIGADNVKIEIDTTTGDVKHLSGYIFFDRYSFIGGGTTSAKIASCPEMLTENATYKLVYDSSNQLVMCTATRNVKGDKFVCLIWSNMGKIQKIIGHPDIVNSVWVDGAKFASQKYSDILESTINRTVCKIFKKVACIGDSYTSGYINNGVHEVERINENFAWTHNMATMTGNEYVNCGASGTTVITWMNHERGLKKLKASGKPQAFMIGLMINDVTNGLPLGSITDRDTNNQTYYGGMCRIIKECYAINPEAKIFIFTRPTTVSSYKPYNEAVREICNHYKSTHNTHCLDLAKYTHYFTQLNLANDYINGHYTAIGYEQFAEAISLIWSKYLTDNIADFQDVAFIPYE